MTLPTALQNLTLAIASGNSLASVAWLLPWVISTLIIALGLFVYGWSDVVRTHWQRIWAISGVCVTESLRRKVLWLTPLAMVGIIVVSQFQVVDGPQDAIQQTTKFCLFASAMLVTLTAIILACTNIPREIESRVIFTIVTKPTTRLEIVLGKVLGYVRVSGMIILIMGVFTLIYLQVRARPMIADLKTQIASLPVNSPLRATDEYYVNSGLLGTRSLVWGSDMQIYSEPPDRQENWSLGGVGEYILIPFALSASDKDVLSAALEKDIPAYLALNLDVKFHPPTEKERQEARDAKLEEPSKEKGDTKFDIPLPGQVTTNPAVVEPPRPLIPQVQVRFMDETRAPLIKTMDYLNAGDVLTLKPAVGGTSTHSGSVAIAPDVLKEAIKAGRFYAQVSMRTPATEFGVKGPVAAITVPVQGVAPIAMAANAADPSQPAEVVFGSYPLRDGIRLTPVREGLAGPVAVFRFRNAAVTPGKDGKVGMQIGVSVEKTTEFKDDPDHPTGYAEATLQVVNLATDEKSEPIKFSPETSRTEPVLVDVRYLQGGNFDVLLRSSLEGQNLGIQVGDSEGGAMALVTADRNFILNLVKGLFILWLLSLLVVIISVFCSTFVSWPIAVVLTLVILLSHWGVEQLGGALDRGTAGRSAVGFIKISDPSTAQLVSGTVDWLTAGLRGLSNFLPDVGAFPVMEDIENGISIPPAKVFGAISVIFCYGLPMLVFSYIILRRKEVAP